jgi:lysophospholipase L1-like esterase
VYCGDNDLAASDTVSAATVAGRFQQLFQLIRSRMPKVEIDYVSIKPSPSRSHLMPKMIEANNLIQAFLARQKRTAFIDVFHPMLDKDGQPRAELFIEDKLHMNATGYKIWQEAIQPHLKK